MLGAGTETSRGSSYLETLVLIVVHENPIVSSLYQYFLFTRRFLKLAIKLLSIRRIIASTIYPMYKIPYEAS